VHYFSLHLSVFLTSVAFFPLFHQLARNPLVAPLLSLIACKLFEISSPPSCECHLPQTTKGPQIEVPPNIYISTLPTLLHPPPPIKAVFKSRFGGLPPPDISPISRLLFVPRVKVRLCQLAQKKSVAADPHKGYFSPPRSSRGFSCRAQVRRQGGRG